MEAEVAVFLLAALSQLCCKDKKNFFFGQLFCT